MDNSQESAQVQVKETKFCKECGEKISAKAEICPKCGCRVEAPAMAQSPQIVINNSNENSNQNQNINQVNVLGARAKNKWVAFFLCLFLGVLGAHKFYEGKVGMGILYLFTGGLFVIGVFIDLIVILCKPNPYYVL